MEMVDFFIALQIYASICWKPLLVETDYAIARYDISLIMTNFFIRKFYNYL